MDLKQQAQLFLGFLLSCSTSLYFTFGAFYSCALMGVCVVILLPIAFKVLGPNTRTPATKLAPQAREGIALSIDFAEKSTFVGSTGSVLRSYVQPPRARPGNGLKPGCPRAVVVCIHSLSLHTGEFAGVAGKFSGLGYLVCGIDREGCGESEGGKGVIKDYQSMVNDVVSYSASLQTQYPGIPLFLCGHGFGGTIAVCCAVRHPTQFQGLLLAAPCVTTLYSPFQQVCLIAFGWLLPFVHVSPAVLANNTSTAQVVTCNCLFKHSYSFVVAVPAIISVVLLIRMWVCWWGCYCCRCVLS